MSRYGVPFVKGPEVRLPSHKLSCGLDGVAALANSHKKPLAIDLFSGAGGLSYGLHLAGFEVILAADKEAEAAATHRAHFPGASIHADLSDQATLDRICEALVGVDLDLVAGGPPCQPYSQAAFSKVRHLQKHHGKKADPRRDLWTSYLYVVAKTRPRAVLVENVPDMAFGRDGIVLRRLVRDLESLGYHVQTRVLSSDNYGVPQHRQRCFTVAFRDGLRFEWPKGDASGRRVLWDAISDLPEVEGGDKEEKRPYAGPVIESQNFYRQKVKKSDQGFIYDHFTRAVRLDDLEIFKLMNSKTKYSDIPKELRRYRSDIFEDKYKRLDWYQLSRTITAHISQDGYWYIHPEQHRTLTIREAARIQTFPDHYRFCGFPRHAFKQIGEAVPPLLGKAVGSAILSALQKSKCDPVPKTAETAALLIDWIRDQRQDEMIQPWLLSRSIWHRCIGQLVFARAGAVQVARGYKLMCDRWPTPQAFILDPARTGLLESHRRAAVVPALEKIAAYLMNADSVTCEDLIENGLSENVALLLLGGTSLSDRKPATTSTARLAERFWGRPVTDVDGRGTQEMLVGRLVGVDETGEAYCGLSEIAARYCHAKNGQCQFCPLRRLCQSSNHRCRPETQGILLEA